MDLNKYTEFTRTTAIYPKNKSLEYLGLGLTSEAGEVAGKIKKYIRDGKFNTEDVVSEIGDVLWYCARLCDSLGVTLADCFATNQQKLEDRKERNVIQGSGDKR